MSNDLDQATTDTERNALLRSTAEAASIAASSPVAAAWMALFRNKCPEIPDFELSYSQTYGLFAVTTNDAPYAFGELLIVDTRFRYLGQPGTYVIREGSYYRIQMMQRIPGSNPPRVCLLNGKVPPEPVEVLASDIEVFGLVAYRFDDYQARIQRMLGAQLGAALATAAE